VGPEAKLCGRDLYNSRALWGTSHVPLMSCAQPFVIPVDLPLAMPSELALATWIRLEF
jgi:hypothetical protein